MKTWLKLALTGVCTVITALCLSWLIFIWPTGRQEAPPRMDEAVAPVSAQSEPIYADRLSSAGIEEYLFKEENGLLVIYQFPNMDIPLHITDINTATLRRSDAQSLSQGVRVIGWENMLAMLEDYGS